MSSSPGMQMIGPMTRNVKALVIANVSIWLILILIVQNMFLSQPYIFQWFGLNPDRVIFDFWIWQPFTYMFLHSHSVFHVLFNMLVLWWFGSELEARWGSRFFLLYYFVCGVGAALIYLLVLVGYLLVTGHVAPLMSPVVGASGAVYGLLLAYGLIFGERVIYFMMLFPMKAKYFVMLLGLVEFLSLMGSGFSGEVANLAHLGGLIAGFIFLTGWTRWSHRLASRKSQRHGRKLRLVVDNEKPEGDKPKGPRYWN